MSPRIFLILVLFFSLLAHVDAKIEKNETPEEEVSFVKTENLSQANKKETTHHHSTIKEDEEEEEDLESNEKEIDEEDLELLSRIIYAEAKGEPFEGKKGVGRVVINRKNSSRFPDSIEEVIFQPGQFCAAGNHNFNGNPCEESREAARVVLSEEREKGALYFINQKKSSPSWINGLMFVERIGDHWFYK